MADIKNHTVAIVLGGTFPHIGLIKNLKRRGFYTILVDYLENPLAKGSADEHLQESTLDKDKVLEIARNRNADLVISTCIDRANVTACYVAEKLGLPLPYDYESAVWATDKELMKKRMVEHNIPTSGYFQIKDVADLKLQEMEFPLIVKPTDSNSSRGVKKVFDNIELYTHAKRALAISRTNSALVEAFKKGKEIGIDCFIKNGEATILMVKERRKIDSPDDSIQQIQGCIWPEDTGKNNYPVLKKCAEQIADAFNLKNTPLMIQAIVDDDGGVNIIEFAPRVGGGESFRIIKLSTGFDMLNAAVDSFLGKEVELDFKMPEYYYAESFIYAEPGTFGYIANYRELMDEGIIEYLDSYKLPGMEIGKEFTSNNRVGVFAVKARNRDKLNEKMTMAIKQINVYDKDGNSIMRKDIYSPQSADSNRENYL